MSQGKGHDGAMGLQLMITTDFAGRLIGSKGSRIQSIRKDTGAQLKVESHEQNGMRACYVGGSSQQVVECLKAMFGTGHERGDEGPMTVEVHVPSAIMGRVIGRGGDNVSQIRRSSGAQVQIERTPPGSMEEIRTIECNGVPDQLERALVAIFDKMEGEGGPAEARGPAPAPRPRPAPYYEDGGGRGWRGGGSSGGYPERGAFNGGWGGPDRGGFDHKGGFRGGPIGAPIGGFGPDRGKGYPSGGGYAPVGGYGPCSGYGLAEKGRDYGKGHSPYPSAAAYGPPQHGWGAYAAPAPAPPPQPLPSAALVFECSNEVAGALIGKGGAVITSIRSESGARFEVKEACRAGGGERCCLIDGDTPQIDACLRCVFDSLAKKAMDDQLTVEVIVLMPSYQMGCIIGSGGAAISKIRTDSGAKIKVDPGLSRSKDAEREASVEGKPAEVCKALRGMVQQLDREGKLFGGDQPGDDAGRGAKRRRDA